MKTVFPLTLLKVTSVCDSPHFGMALYCTQINVIYKGLFNALLIESTDTSVLLTSKTPEQKKEWLEAFNNQLVVLRFVTKARAASQMRQSSRALERRDSSAQSSTNLNKLK